MLNRVLIFESEKKEITDFLNIKNVDIPPLPDWIDNKLVQYWNENLFHVHYLPKVCFDENLTLSKWQDKPHKIFYKKIYEGKINERAKLLSGTWILIDGRNKPPKKVPWITSGDTRIFKKIGFDPKNYFKKWSKQAHQREYLINILKKKGFGSRFCLSIHDINELKPFILKFLKIDKEKNIIRLPFFMEYNYLGNSFYKQWASTETWEWLEDKFEKEQNLAGGSESVGCLGWEPPEFWSTILTFRPVIEL